MIESKYAKYSLKTLMKWRDKTYHDYYEETLKSHGNWGDGMRLSKLPTFARWNRLRDKYYELEKEIALKEQQNDGEQL